MANKFSYEDIDKISSDYEIKMRTYILETLLEDCINYDDRNSILHAYKKKITHNYLKRINLDEYQFTKNKNQEIKFLYDEIIKSEEEKLNNILLKYDKEFLGMTFYKVFSELAFFYNVFNKLIAFDEKSRHELFQICLKERVPLSFTKILISERFDVSFRQKFSRFIGIDRYIIQLIFKLLSELSLEDEYNSKRFVLTESDMKNIYLSSFSIIQLLSERDYFSNYIDDDCLLYVNNFNFLVTNYGRFDYIAAKATENINEPYVIIDEKLIEKLDRNFKRYYSFGFNDIEKLQELFNNVEGVWLIDEDILMQKLRDLKLQDSTIYAMLEYLTLNCNCSHQSILVGVRNFEKRIYANPFYRIGNKYLISTYLFDYIKHFFIENLIYNKFEKCNKLNSSIIDKHYNKMLEHDIHHVLQKYDIGSKKNYMLDNYEIDILFILKQTLYIVECKNLKYSVSPDEWVNDRRKLKDYIKNIKKKIDLIDLNRKKLCDDFNVIIEKTVPIIVYKKYNLSANLYNSKEALIFSENEFDKWLAQMQNELD